MEIRKIYDGFLFFNELDLLEIRLNTLNDVVDKFILVESSVTHSGLPKPFYFEENKERFSKFLDKIIHIKVTNTPDAFITMPTSFTDDYEGSIFKQIWEHIKVNNAFNRATQPNYGRDFYQKECIKLGMKECNDNDIILSSDLDEIPNPEILSRLDEFYDYDNKSFYTFIQSHYCYYLNLLHYSYSNNIVSNKDITSDWYGSRMGSYKYIKDLSLNVLRSQQNNSIADGGWHFSYMGGLQKISEKLSATSAQELNNDRILSSLETNFKENKDIIYRAGSNLVKVSIDDNFPEYLVNNINNYQHLIKK
jgi:beta-1,4-mannosyl-glycoprotein beta-1,4-N-acetylglucosaminyltransferase